jgi:squalene-hopene/tetraprenyl-beta-curcumene cyclase
VLTGLAAIREDMRQPWIQKAVTWLVNHQNPDGGWGETCESYTNPALAGVAESVA